MSLDKNLKDYILRVNKRVIQRQKKLGLISANTPENKLEDKIQLDTEESFERASSFIEENNSMCQIWRGAKCKANRKREEEIYSVVSIFEDKCIDGRDPRAFDGQADSLKTEMGQITLDRVSSDGELIPRQPEICASLNDVSVEPLMINLPHYDPYFEGKSCAAIRLAMEDFRKTDGVWAYLTEQEKDLITQARSRSLDEANLALLSLTNIAAFSNFHNDVRADEGLVPLKSVGLVALYNTRTMGIELRAPILIQNKDSKELTLAPFDREVIKTAEIAASLPQTHFGEFRLTFNKTKTFADFEEAVITLAIQLLERKIDFEHKEDIRRFINKYFAELTSNQAKALEYRMFRAVAHQYLTGLSKVLEQHPFSDHEERFISISENARFVGKYDVEDQSFVISVPDSETGAKRIDIACSVMDHTRVDKEKAHILFISTSINKEGFEKRNQIRDGHAYLSAINDNELLFRSLTGEGKLSDRISKGNLLPIGVLLDSQTGEVLEVVKDNYRYI